MNSIKQASLAIMLSTVVVLPSHAVLLSATVRDFNDTHPDFEYVIASELGIVAPTLGADGKPVYVGGGGVTTNGAAVFDQWYRDVPGINLTKSILLDFAETAPGSGIYNYSNSSFFPIDGELLGNQGRSHNYHFTLELNTEFTYMGGESFSFTGDDDLWVFINKKLAIDLGGVHGALSSTVSLDAVAASLGISVGGTYALDLFFAERHTTQSNFNVTTGLLLSNPPTPGVPEPATIVLFGAGLVAASCVRRRLR